MSRKIAENLEQPFDKTLLARARQIAAGYRILIEKNERLGYIGSSVEIPTVFADARTPAACYKATEEALTVAVATPCSRPAERHRIRGQTHRTSQHPLDCL